MSDHESAPKRNMVAVPMKHTIQGVATAILANGDVVCLTVLITNVRKVLGEVDDQGNQKYDADMNMLFGVPQKVD